MIKQKYRVRYSVQEWGKAIPNIEETEKTCIDGVRTVKGDWGYADECFLASIILDEETKEIGSILLMDSINGANPSRKILEAIRDFITHYLEHHCE